MNKIYLDFETRSCADLLKVGAYIYSRHATTKILCMGFAIDDDEPEIWVPGQPQPKNLLAALTGDYQVISHNAEFERLIWYYVLMLDYDGFPLVGDARWRCTAYQARCNNLPAALGDCAQLVTAGAVKKDLEGGKVMKMLCKPQKDGTFFESPETTTALHDYCKDDIKAMRAIHGLMRVPTPEEEEDYQANVRVNDRGIMIDTEFARAATEYATAEVAEFEKKVGQASGGELLKARGEKLKAWVVERLPPETLALLGTTKTGAYSLGTAQRDMLLALDDLPPAVRDVLYFSDQVMQSSVSKFAAMLQRAGPVDRRVKGAYIANGASASGRFSARGIQPHNFVRDVMSAPMIVRTRICNKIPAEQLRMRYDLPIMVLLSRMLRAAIIPRRHHTFLVSDWSAIEGRVAPWLAKSRGGERKLDLYRQNKPVYEIAAAQIYKIPVGEVTKELRQIGKVAELSFQFGGGAGAYISMAEKFGMHPTEGEALHARDGWRKANAWATVIWREVNEAILAAINLPGKEFTAGRMTYFVKAKAYAGHDALFCRLPGGGLLTYPGIRTRRVPRDDFPNLKTDEITCWRPVGAGVCKPRDWPRMKLWAGQFFNNAVQGTAARIHRHALRKLVDEPVVLHTHDEIVIEAPTRWNRHRKNNMREVMNTSPPWAKTLPLKAEVLSMTRYGK